MTGLAYRDFEVVPETRTDGWSYGAITQFIDPEHYPDGCDSGDGFVEAPSGYRAGLVWSADCEVEIREIYPPEADRWGVWEVRFPRPVRTVEDLVFNFRRVLPLLQARYLKITRPDGSASDRPQEGQRLPYRALKGK